MNQQHHDDDHTPRDANAPVRGDRLDELLRAWHDEHKDSARAVRDAHLAAIERDAAGPRRRGVAGRWAW